MKHFSPAVLVADILVEIDHVLRVVGAPKPGAIPLGMERFRPWHEHLTNFSEQLPGFVTA